MHVCVCACVRVSPKLTRTTCTNTHRGRITRQHDTRSVCARVCGRRATHVRTSNILWRSDESNSIFIKKTHTLTRAHRTSAPAPTHASGRYLDRFRGSVRAWGKRAIIIIGRYKSVSKHPHPSLPLQQQQPRDPDGDLVNHQQPSAQLAT